MSEGRRQLLLHSHDDLHASETEMDKILMLKRYLTGVQAIHDTLASAQCKSSLCESVRQNCSPEVFGAIQSMIDEKIEQYNNYSKAPIETRNNRIWAVKVWHLDLLTSFVSRN